MALVALVVNRPEFVVARNPDPESTLPYLIRLPLGAKGVVLKARDTWPRTAKVFLIDLHVAKVEVIERLQVLLSKYGFCCGS